MMMHAEYDDHGYVNLRLAYCLGKRGLLPGNENFQPLQKALEAWER